jgi:hypothetical protein
MASHDYEFVSHWRVRGAREEVFGILEDVGSFPRWWPQVYLEATKVEKGDERGIGRVWALWTRGRLPYTLRWNSRLVETRRPDGFTVAATGDFVGQGTWTLTQDGDHVDVRFDWRIRADKPLLRYLSFVMKPLFAANHRWAMARGEESLRRELDARRAVRDVQSRDSSSSTPMRDSTLA